MKSSNTSNRLILSTECANPGGFQVSVNPRHRTLAPRTRDAKRVENAVYAYIRAVRALGRTKLITAEIADALSLSTVEVNEAISSLKEKGVRVLNG